MKKNKVIRVIAYIVLALMLIILFSGIFGIRYFNNLWFKERVDLLIIKPDFQPIEFIWTESSYGDYVEKKDAILIPAKINGIRNNLSLQFDTGDPTTRIYGESLHSLQQLGLKIKVVSKDEKKYIETLKVDLGGSLMELKMVEIEDAYGESFNAADTINTLRIGTIGADFLSRHITEIDFKNQQINFYQERETWMTLQNDFMPFDFTGRRFMLPCTIGNKKMELFYDSGSSAFGLITTKNRYLNYSKKEAKEITYNANMHGDPIPVRHKQTNQSIEIGGKDLGLERVSFVDMYSNFQGLLSPFTRIGGWLGNKPFANASLIFDIQNEAFIVVEK